LAAVSRIRWLPLAAYGPGESTRPVVASWMTVDRWRLALLGEDGGDLGRVQVQMVVMLVRAG
jgi:hypothetical protein